MSRIGKKPIPVPTGVRVTLDGQRVAADGPQGQLELEVPAPILVQWDEERDQETLVVKRPSDAKEHRSLHGLTRSLVANLVEGVGKGFSKTLEIVGVGYRVQAEGTGLRLSLGFSHTIDYAAPDGIRFELPNQTTIVVRGVDKQQVGHTAAVIRSFRPPEPYKGKGIRYQGEHIRRKAGKKAGA